MDRGREAIQSVREHRRVRLLCLQRVAADDDLGEFVQAEVTRDRQRELLGLVGDDGDGVPRVAQRAEVRRRAVEQAAVPHALVAMVLDVALVGVVEPGVVERSRREGSAQQRAGAVTDPAAHRGGVCGRQVVAGAHVVGAGDEVGERVGERAVEIEQECRRRAHGHRYTRAPSMKLAPSVLMLSLLASCGSFRNWRELQTEPMTLGDAWQGCVDIVTSRDGWVVDHSATDRGNGVWQSRWKRRETERNFPVRSRLCMEILVDDGSRQEGWLVRYAVEQEICEDLRRHQEPAEEDWSSYGQNTEAEAVLGERLVRRLAPDSVELKQPGRM